MVGLNKAHTSHISSKVKHVINSIQLWPLNSYPSPLNQQDGTHEKTCPQSCAHFSSSQKQYCNDPHSSIALQRVTSPSYKNPKLLRRPVGFSLKALICVFSIFTLPCTSRSATFIKMKKSMNICIVSVNIFVMWSPDRFQTSHR